MHLFHGVEGYPVIWHIHTDTPLNPGSQCYLYRCRGCEVRSPGHGKNRRSTAKLQRALQHGLTSPIRRGGSGHCPFLRCRAQALAPGKGRWRSGYLPQTSALSGDVAGGGADPQQGLAQVALAARSNLALRQGHGAKFAVCLSYIPLGVTLATGIQWSLRTDNSPNSYKMLA